MEKYKELQSKIKQLKEEAGKLVVDTLKEEFANIFKKYPDLQGFCWHQYTPYWNDGDACQFSVQEVYPENLFFEDEEGDYNNERHNKICSDINNILFSFNQDDLEMVFGDHITVHVSSDGITLEEYDHD